MELWGGHECTVNRVGDTYRDQTRLTGHEGRLDDLGRFAALGIRRLRYPVLWERVAPDDPEQRDWTWSDARLAEIARLGMAPILGLLHHGSGPRYTSLDADDFAALFADYAAAAAERYPHVADWTPINEPLTTARFALLYGLWYPHVRDEARFWRAMLNQVDATRAAMQAIRRVNPAARLVQTEDLGRCYATPEAAGVADFYNERRWATWDLLAGRVTRDHPLWPHLSQLGLGERLRAIADDPCPPDIVGVNFYPTSERFLDHRIDAYPFDAPVTGYHDLTALRVMAPPPPGLAGVLREAWERYRLPLAVTECHLGCSREEQLRWLWQSWRSCRELAREGVDIRAFTAWALLGGVDWDSLITIDAGHYEAGAFDVRGGTPRPTAIARLLETFGSGAEPTPQTFPGIDTPGWWQRDTRFEHAPVVWRTMPDAPAARSGSAPILITGATGTLGRAMAQECELRGLSYRATSRATLPVENAADVTDVLDAMRPWAVINTAGWVRVDDAEAEPDACHRANSDGAAVLAEACAARGIRYTVFSSDLVFDGAQDTPYLESHAAAPLNVYGASKARAETLAARAHPEALIVRTAAFFSPHDPYNFAMAVERALRCGERFAASADHTVSPTFVPDLVRACLDLTVDGAHGIWHLTSGTAVSWLAFAERIAAALGLRGELLRAGAPEELGWRAARPRYAALGSERGAMLPSLDDAIARHAAARRHA